MTKTSRGSHGRRSSPFRFVTSHRRGEYSVWRGDEAIGYVTKNVHRFAGKLYQAGWIPTTPERSELATVPGKRDDAARVLWERWQTRKR